MCVAGLASSDPPEIILTLIIRRDASPEPQLKFKETDKLTFKSYPEPKKFRDWWTHFIQTVIEGSGRPTDAHQWIKEVEDATEEDDLPTTPQWQTLDVKIATGLFNILEDNLKKEISLLRVQLAKRKPSELLSGRHIAFKI